MGRLEISMRCMEIRSLLDEGELEQAYEMAENLNIERVTSIVDLKVIASVYERMGKYEDALDILHRSYEKKPTKMAVYRLAYLCVKTENFDDAEFFYREFADMAPDSPDKYILRYGIDRAKGVDYYVRIATLQKLKAVDYREEWGYELAKVYHKAGLYEDCVKECDDLILWFGEGVIVEKAKLLKKYHTEGKSSLDAYGVFERNLTPEQVEYNREKFRFDTQDLGRQIRELVETEEEQQLKDDLERELEKTVDLRKAMIEDTEALDLLGREVHRSWGSVAPAQGSEVIKIKKLRAKNEQGKSWKNKKSTPNMEEIFAEEEQNTDVLPTEEDWEIRESVAVQPKFQATELQEELAREIARFNEEDTSERELIDDYAYAPFFDEKNYDDVIIYKEGQEFEKLQIHVEESDSEEPWTYEEEEEEYKEEPDTEEPQTYEEEEEYKEEPDTEESQTYEEEEEYKEEPDTEEPQTYEEEEEYKEEPDFEEPQTYEEEEEYKEEPDTEEPQTYEEEEEHEEEPDSEEVQKYEGESSPGKTRIHEEKQEYEEEMVKEGESDSEETLINEQEQDYMEQQEAENNQNCEEIFTQEEVNSEKAEILDYEQKDRNSTNQDIVQETNKKTESMVGEEKTMNIFRRLLNRRNNNKQEENAKEITEKTTITEEVYNVEETENIKKMEEAAEKVENADRKEGLDTQVKTEELDNIEHTKDKESDTKSAQEKEESIETEFIQDLSEQGGARVNVVKVKPATTKENKKHAKVQISSKDKEHKQTTTTGVVKRYMGKKIQDMSVGMNDNLQDSVTEVIGTPEKEEFCMSIEDVYKLFPRYQQNIQVCEEMLALLQGVLGRKEHGNMIVTSKNSDNAKVLCADIADVLHEYGVIENKQLVAVSAEELNKMHLEQNYEHVRGRVMQIISARKITPDTAQSIMNMVDELGNNVIVVLNDGKPYMDDFMNEYKIMQKYFPHWIML